MQSHLPAWLKGALDKELHGVSGKALAAEYFKLSENYRQGKPSASADPRMFWLSYAVGRMPATYAAVQAALAEVPQALLESCADLLDLGAGPGSATWAAMECMPSLQEAWALDHSEHALAMGAAFGRDARFQPQFQLAELPAGIAAAPEADLVILAYAAGEAGPALLQAAAAKAKKLFVVIEPGTPAGFKVILQARSAIANLVAPCPQAGECPMAPSPESKWCHFSTRLERSRMAALLKGGELGYEDEKFSYAAFATQPFPRAQARIVGYVRKAEGQVTLSLCEATGLRSLQLGRNRKAEYKKAKKAQWGDAWP
jgi:ribosomal protein RSM22 (predicted rRNA methylase)